MQETAQNDGEMRGNKASCYENRKAVRPEVKDVRMTCKSYETSMDTEFYCK